MKLFAVRCSVLAAMGLAVGTGCARKSPPPAPVTRPVEAAAPTETTSAGAARSRDLSRLTEEYSQLSHELPGRTFEENRQAARAALTKMDAILALLSDPHNDLAMRENLATLEESRDRLGDNATAETVQAATDSGLRSAYNALDRISRDKDFLDQDFSAPMKGFGARLDELDTVHGLTHQVVVAEAVDASAVVVSKMSDVIASRIPPDSGVPTTGATGSSVTTAPATTAPATVAPPTQPAPDAAAVPAAGVPATSVPATGPVTAPATPPADATPAVPATLPATVPSGAPAAPPQ
jgi:hypothetical protein